VLTERQRKASVLARELRAAGANVTSPLPLYDGSPLRFRVSAVLAEQIVQDLKEDGWEARFVASGPEFHLDGTTKSSHTFEINLPIERTVIPGDRIMGELASSDKTPAAEVVAMLKHLGMK